MNPIQVQARLDAFVSWFTSQGGHIHPAAELAYDLQRGVHLRIKQNAVLSTSSKNTANKLPRGTLVISCPHSASLSALNAHGLPPFFPNRLANFTEKDATFLTRLQIEARPQFVAAVWLCAQWLHGEKSWWREYLNILPGLPLQEDDDVGVDMETRGLGEVDSPMWWTEEELAWMKGTNLDRGREDLERAWREEWKRWGMEVKAWAETRGWEIKWSLLKWSLTILGSRAFSSSQIASVPSALKNYNPDMLLYPGVDSLNHNPLTQNRWVCDAERFGIVCEDLLGPGDEVWNPYGGKGNGELLLSYGFALPNNPCDTFALRLPQPPHPLIAVVEAAHRHAPQFTAAAASIATQAIPTGLSLMTPHNTPPAFSLAHNTYYLRSSSRFTTPEPHYPSLSTTTTTTTTQLLSFPTLLLTTLTLSLSHPHELLHLQTDPVHYNTSTLYLHLGARPLVATTSLLLARLKMELKRLDTLVAANEQENSLMNMTARSKRRWDCVNVLLEGQRGILRDGIGRMEEWISRFLSLSNTASLLKPSSLTLPTALTLLSAISDPVSAAFIAAIETLFGTSDVEALREAECEEEVWVLWIGVVVPLVEGAGGMPLSWLRDWIAFLRKTYNFPALPAHDTAKPSLSLAEEEEDEATAQMTSYISSLVSSITASTVTQNTPGEKIWLPDRWTTSFIRSCVKVVRSEGVVVRLKVDETAKEGQEEEAEEAKERDVLVLFIANGRPADEDAASSVTFL